LLKRSLAFGAEMATDGAIGGAVDNAFRAAYDGGSLEDVGNAAVQGFVGGAVMSPIIGGGMKFAGKSAQKIFGSNNVHIDADGNRVRINDDGAIIRIDENGNEISNAAAKVIHTEKEIERFLTDRGSLDNNSKEYFTRLRVLSKIQKIEENSGIKIELDYIMNSDIENYINASEESIIFIVKLYNTLNHRVLSEDFVNYEKLPKVDDAYLEKLNVLNTKFQKILANENSHLLSFIPNIELLFKEDVISKYMDFCIRLENLNSKPLSENSFRFLKNNPEHLNLFIEILNKRTEFNTNYRTQESISQLIGLIIKNPDKKDLLLSISDLPNAKKSKYEEIMQIWEKHSDLTAEINSLAMKDYEISQIEDFIPLLKTADKTDALFILSHENLNITNRNKLEEVLALRGSAKYEEILKFSKNKNLSLEDINTIIALKEKYNTTPNIAKMIDIVASENKLPLAAINKLLEDIKIHSEFVDIILSQKTLMDFLDTPPSNCKNFDLRKSLSEKIEKIVDIEQLKFLKELLGPHYANIKWEELINENTTPENINDIIFDLINKSSAFTRISFVEKMYGKNSHWASSALQTSQKTSVRIRAGEDFETILSSIADDYHYEAASRNIGYENNTGVRRGIKSRGSAHSWTDYDKTKYEEYYERFQNIYKLYGKEKPSPYADVKITQVTDYCMWHPNDEGGLNSNTAIMHCRENYEKILPFIEKIKNGELLTDIELQNAKGYVAEIHYLLTNAMPYSRGSAGIADCLTRSFYDVLGLELPIVKKGLGLDLEAFCLNLDDYKKNWDSFFEERPVNKTNINTVDDTIPLSEDEIAEILLKNRAKENSDNYQIKSKEEILDLLKAFDIKEKDLSNIDITDKTMQVGINLYCLFNEFYPELGLSKREVLQMLQTKDYNDISFYMDNYAHLTRKHFETLKEALPTEAFDKDITMLFLMKFVSSDEDFSSTIKARVEAYETFKTMAEGTEYGNETSANLCIQIDGNNKIKLDKFLSEINKYENLKFEDLCYMFQNVALNENAFDNKLAMYKFLKSENLPMNELREIVGYISQNTVSSTIDLYKALKGQGFTGKDLVMALKGTNDYNINARKELLIFLKESQFSMSEISEILSYTKGKNIKSKIEFFNKLKQDANCTQDDLKKFISYVDESNQEFLNTIYQEVGLSDTKVLLEHLRPKDIKAKAEFLNYLKASKFNIKKYLGILNNTNKNNILLAEVLCNDDILDTNNISFILSCTQGSSDELIKDSKPSAVMEYYQYLKEKHLLTKKSLQTLNAFKKEFIARSISAIDVNNLNIAKKICIKDLDIEIIIDILHNYQNGSDKVILEFIDNGLLKSYPRLSKCNPSFWHIIHTKGLLDYIDTYGVQTVVALAKADNPNVLNDFIALKSDAFSSRSLLKSGTEDLTDLELNSILNRSETVRTLDIVGRGTLEAAFPLKVEGFKDCCEDIARLKLSPKNMETLMQKINPTNSRTYREISEKIAATKRRINELVGNETSKQIKALQNQRVEIEEQLKILTARKNDLITTLGEEAEEVIALKTQIKDLQKQSKALGGQAQALYFKGENADEIKRIMNVVNTLNKELQNITKESKELEPQDILTKIRVLAAISEKADDNEVAAFIELIKPSSLDNNTKWYDAINRKLFDILGVEYDENVSARLDLINCKYLAEMFLSEDSFNYNFAKLINLVKEHPDKSIAEIFDLLPQNQETRKMFEDIGINYDKWCQIDKDSYKSARIQLDAEKAKQAAILSLEEDLNDELFRLLPKENTQQILNNLETIGITLKRSKIDVFVDDGISAGQKEFYRLYKDGNPIAFEDMPQIISVIEKTINKDEFWFREHPNVDINEARKHIYEHLIKLRTNDVDVAKSIATNDVIELEVRKTDMYDIKKAIGLGNDGQCCTAVGSFNAFSAPTYIMNKCIGAIELVDQGNFVGNTMIYLANVDGNPALVLDNIELKSKYRYNNTIRDTFMDYAKQLCDEIGQPDLPIYAGPNRHKLTMDEVYPKENHSMQIIGSTSEDRVYIDGITGGMTIDGQATIDLEMYKIR